MHARVSTHLVVPLRGQVEGLHQRELGHRGQQVERVEGRHGHQDKVEDGEHLRPGEHVDAQLSEEEKMHPIRYSIFIDRKTKDKKGPKIEKRPKTFCWNGMNAKL